MTDIRPLESGDLERFVEAMSGPFGFDLPEAAEERTALLERMARLFEPARARCAFDGSKIVGTLGVFSFTMTVPGGTIPVAGTTQVTVQVTHRRQGVLSRMMRSHLEEALEHGDAAAALWASDSAIYGRYGFGMASWSTEVEVDRRYVDFHRKAADPHPVDILDMDGIRAPAIAVYDRVRAAVPGMMQHNEAWWDRIFGDQPWNRGGAGRARYGLVTEGGTPTGWVLYRLKDTEGHGHPAQDVMVSHLYADSPGAWAGLWSHVLSHDFGQTVRARLRPIDDPIHSLLRGVRRAATTISDGVWVRVLDVARILEARTYPTAGSIGLTIHDPLGFTTGTYRLDTDGAASRVTRSDAGEVEMDIEDLSALSLGGRSAVELAMAGRLRGDDAAIRRLDTLMRGPRAPWSPVIF